MEANEHLLLIQLLTQQNIFLKQLCDALKSKGVLTDEEIKLFGDFLRSDETYEKVMIDRTRRLYLREAKKLGVVTGVEVPKAVTSSPDLNLGRAFIIVL